MAFNLIVDNALNPHSLSEEKHLSDDVIRVFHNRGFNDARSILDFMLFKSFQLRKVENMKEADSFLNDL